MSQSLEIPEPSKSILMEIVQELKFVEPKYKLRRHSCCKCESMAIQYRIPNCEDLFCRKCYRRCYFRPCCMCNATITRHKKDVDFERSLYKLRVACKFNSRGCQAIVCLGEYLDHVKKCTLSTGWIQPEVCDQDSGFDFQKRQDVMLQKVEKSVEEMQAEVKQMKDDIMLRTRRRRDILNTMDKSINETKLHIHQFSVKLQEDFNKRLGSAIKYAIRDEWMDTRKLKDDMITTNTSSSENVTTYRTMQTPSEDKDEDDCAWIDWTDLSWHSGKLRDLIK